MKKCVLLPVLLLATALFAMPLFAGGQSEKPTPDQVRAAVFKGPSGFGAAGLLDHSSGIGEGLGIQTEVLPSPREMIARISSGELDIAVLPANLAAKLYNGGKGYQMGAVVGFGLLHLLSADDSVRSWEDLQGKTVYSVGKGASPDYLLQFFLNKAGLVPGESVEIDYSIQAAPQLVQALLASKVEYAVLPEPFVSLAMKKSDNLHKLISFQESWVDLKGGSIQRSYPITTLLVSPDFAGDYPELCDQVLSAYADSIEWVNQHPEDAAKIIEEHGIMPAAIAGPAIPFCNLAYMAASESRPAMESYLRLLLDFQPASVGGKLPDDSFYRE